ncbi:MAG: glycosyltransferase family 4 protein [Nitritalea sp.]
MSTSRPKAQPRPSTKPVAISINPFLDRGGIGTFTLHLAHVWQEDYHRVLILTHYGGTLEAEARAAFDEVHVLPPSGSLQRLRGLHALLRQLQPALTLLNNAPTANYLLPVLGAKGRGKVISVIHSDDPRYYRLDTRAAYWIDAFVGPSPKVAATLPQYLPPIKKHRILCIPHGVPIPEQLPQSAPHPKRLLFVGQLDTHKGVLLLPELLEILHQKDPELELHLVGEGPLRERLEAEARARQLQQHLFFHGHLRGAALQQAYAASSFFVFPTRLESFGLVIPEAMGQGCIPILSHLPGITDAFLPENTPCGALLPLHADAQAYAEALLPLLQAPAEQRLAMRQAAHRHALQHFSLQQLQKAYRQLFADLQAAP